MVDTDIPDQPVSLEEFSGLREFESLSKPVKSLLAAAFTRRSFSFGQPIVTGGTTADSYFVLTRGRVRIVTSGDREVSIGLLEQGHSFGEDCADDEAVRVVTVRASSDVEVLRLDAELLRALMATNVTVRACVVDKAKALVALSSLALNQFFPELPSDVATQILRNAQSVDLAAGRSIFEGESEKGSLLLVHKGVVRMTAPAGLLVDYRRGGLFSPTGPTGALDVHALTDARLFRIPDPDAAELFARFPGLGEPERSERADPASAPGRRPIGRPAVADSMDGQSRATDAPASTWRTDDHLPTRRIRRFRLIRQFDEMDCGAACLAMVCGHFGHEISLSTARRASGTAFDGTSMRGLVLGAKELGLEAAALKVSYGHLDSLALPAALHWGGNHWVIAWSVTAARLRIADPAVGMRSIPLREVEEKWNGYAVVFKTTDSLPSEAERRTGASWLWPHFRRSIAGIALAAVLALVTGALRLSLPVFLQLIVDEVIPAHDSSMLRLLMIALVAVLIVITAVSVLQRLLLSRAAVRIDRSALDFLTDRLLALPMRFFYTRRTGDIQRRLAGVRLVRDFAVQNGVVALTAITQLIVTIVLMARYSELLTWIFLAMMPVYAVLMRLASTRLKPVYESLEESFGVYFSRQIDAVKGIEAVKAVTAERQLRRQLAADFNSLSGRLFRADFGAMVYSAAVQILGFASVALFLGVGANQVLTGDLTVGAFVSFNALVILANTSVVALQTIWDELQLHSVVINRVADVFDEEPEQGSDHSSLIKVEKLRGRIQVMGLRFAYGRSADSTVLHDISLDVEAGRTVAIVGRSGSGKTTFAKCLVGLVQPTGGQILFDGVDINQLDLASLRTRIGFVPQDSYIFSDTVAANIALGHEQPDMDRVRWVARAADVDGFVRQLPLGYETRIGETGILLSGGQRQRIALARALYPRPQVLILDEATSSLDAESERAVQQSLFEHTDGRTCLIIAHRLSTVRRADLIVVFDKGRLVEQGTYQELLDREGVFHLLAAQQIDE